MQRSGIRERPTGRSSYPNIQWDFMNPGFRCASSGLRLLNRAEPQRLFGTATLITPGTGRDTFELPLISNPVAGIHSAKSTAKGDLPRTQSSHQVSYFSR